MLSTWGVVLHWIDSVGSMPRRHERDVQDVMKQIARELRAASDASLDHGPTTLQAHAQALRDISGLCRRGLMRMAISALERGLERSLFARMRQSQAVQDILTYSRNCDAEEREQLAVILLNELGMHDPDPVEAERGTSRLTPRLPSRELFVSESPERSPSRGRHGEEPHDASRVGDRQRGPLEVGRPVARRQDSRDEVESARSRGSMRPVSPVRRHGGRPLPPPPIPGEKRPRPSVWDQSWADLIKCSMTVKKGDAWITCKACTKWFRKPSAFKQHLLVKQSLGSHPDGSVTTQWNYDEMWDQQFEALVRSDPAHSQEDPRRVGQHGSDAPVTNESLAERFAALESLGVPPPPLPPGKRPRIAPAKHSVQWYLDQMLEEEIARAEYPLATDDAWVPFVDEISQQIVANLGSDDESRNVICTFPQVVGANSVDFKVNMRWGVEDLVSHLTSSLSMNFNDLGARWSIRYVGHQVHGGGRTLILEVFFSPGKDSNNRLKTCDPIPQNVKSLLAGLERPAVEPAGSMRGAEVANPSDLRIPRVETSSAHTPQGARTSPLSVPSHGVAPVASSVDYEDVVIPDMMDIMAQQPKFPVKKPPVLPPSGLEAGALKSHLFSRLRIISETVCLEPKVQDKIGRLCSQILDQFEGPTLQVGAFVELLTDLMKLLETKKVVEPDKIVPLQAHLMLAQHGVVCHGEVRWPKLTSDWLALLKALLYETSGGEVSLRSMVDQLVQNTAGRSDGPPVGDEVPPHTRERSSPAEEVLRGSEMTQRFTISAAVESHSLFSTAPDTSGREVVRTDDSWSRPGAYMERFAVFVDGVASTGNRSGVLGHAGFPYMCVLCGGVPHEMGLCHEKPCCEVCQLGNPSLAEVNASWRIRGAQEAEIHHVPWLGMSSPPRGDSVDSPEVVIQEVKNEFLVSSIGTCNLRSNVCVDLVRPFHLGSYLAFEVVDTSGEGKGVLAFDDWYRDHFDFFPHQRFWIAGLTLWGSLKGSVIHFLHPPHLGTGIARQSSTGGGLVSGGRVLELLSGIGGWSTALLELGLVNEVFAVDAPIDPCETLAARHKVVGRTVKQFLADATHQRFEVLQADIIDPSWWVATLFGPWFTWSTFSSPCVCFSGAGWKKGILTVEGKALLR